MHWPWWGGSGERDEKGKRRISTRCQNVQGRMEEASFRANCDAGHGVTQQSVAAVVEYEVCRRVEMLSCFLESRGVPSALVTAGLRSAGLARCIHEHRSSPSMSHSSPRQQKVDSTDETRGRSMATNGNATGESSAIDDIGIDVSDSESSLLLSWSDNDDENIANQHARIVSMDRTSAAVSPTWLGKMCRLCLIEPLGLHDSITLNCRHTFHASCITRTAGARATRSSCVMCWKTFTSADVDEASSIVKNLNAQAKRKRGEMMRYFERGRESAKDSEPDNDELEPDKLETPRKSSRKRMIPRRVQDMLKTVASSANAAEGLVVCAHTGANLEHMGASIEPISDTDDKIRNGAEKEELRTDPPYVSRNIFSTRSYALEHLTPTAAGGGDHKKNRRDDKTDSSLQNIANNVSQHTAAESAAPSTVPPTSDQTQTHADICDKRLLEMRKELERFEALQLQQSIGHDLPLA